MRIPLLSLLITFAYFLLPILAARRLPRSYTPGSAQNHDSPQIPACKTNAECIRRDLPVLPPTRRSRVRARDAPAPSPFVPNRFTYTPSVQQYTVPAAGRYSVRVVGGTGGGNTAAATDRVGGAGGDSIATFTFPAGLVLNIVTGGAATTISTTNGAGGGGGSFVYVGTTPLLVAGGGGGAISTTNGRPASLTTTGTSGSGMPMAGGGVNGNGGAAGGSPGGGAGGAGFNDDGTDAQAQGMGPQQTSPAGLGGSGFPDFAGGLGSQRSTGSNSGAFGGGGGGGNSGGGGGGGYSGGGGGRGQTGGPGVGGGGARFVGTAYSPTGATFTLSTTTGNGFVTITRLN